MTTKTKVVKITPSEAFTLLTNKLNEFVEIQNRNLNLWTTLKNVVLVEMMCLTVGIVIIIGLLVLKK